MIKKYTLTRKFKHIHIARLGEDKNGRSSTQEEHSHPIIKGVVQTANGHTHKLREIKKKIK